MTPYQISLDSETWSSTYGTLSNNTMRLEVVGTTVISIPYMDIRVSSLNSGETPSITVTANSLADLDYFSFTFPCTIRTGPVVGSGGFITHTANSSSLTINISGNISSTPAGKLHIMK